jgi:hypothetical protein
VKNGNRHKPDDSMKQPFGQENYFGGGGRSAAGDLGADLDWAVAGELLNLNFGGCSPAGQCGVEHRFLLCWRIMEGDGEGGRRSCLLCCVVFCSALVCSVLLARLTPTRQATLVGSSTHTHTSLLLLHFTSLHLTSLHLTALHCTSRPLTTFRRLAPASRVLPGLSSAGRTLDGEWPSRSCAQPLTRQSDQDRLDRPHSPR